MLDTPRHETTGTAHQRHLDGDAWRDVYVVGDVHGCLSELQALFDRLSITEDDLVVFVGDLVRKGPRSEAVVDFVRDRPNCTSVLGNNERKLLEGRESESLTAPTLEYLRSLPVLITIDSELAVVHGGVHPDRDLSEQDSEEVLTLRSLRGDGYEPPFWFDEYRGPPRVCFGHTVLEEPLDTDWAIGLDTGCVYGGALTAFDYRRDAFVSVTGHEHQYRDGDSILSPSDLLAPQ